MLKAKVIQKSPLILKSVGAAPNLQKIGQRLGIKLDNNIGRQLFDNLNMTVDKYISLYRKGSIRGEFPSEYLEKTIEEALLSKNTTVKKLLTDGRFIKK